MKCTNPKMKSLVHLYQFGALKEEQAIRVEAHLMECQACLEELFHASPVLKIFEEIPDQFMEALEPRMSRGAKLKHFLIKKIDPFSKQFFSIFSPFIILTRRPVIKILIPLVAVALLVIMILPKSSVDYSDLAIIAKAPYLRLRLQQPDKVTQSKKLFEEAMSSYQLNNYDDVIQKLDSLLIINPDEAEGEFYRGVCLLLTEKIEDGMQKLQSASKLSQKQNNKILLARCYWYLGNAYLKLNDEKSALENFHKIVLLGEIFEEEAKSQIAKIEERKNKPKP